MQAQELPRPSWQCVHFVEAADVEDIVKNSTSTPVTTLQGNLTDVENETELLTIVARTMRFPDYFGGNWDALDECLRDMAWLKSVGYILILHGATKRWQSVPMALGKLIESWQFAAEEWAKDKVGFHLVFVL